MVAVEIVAIVHKNFGLGEKPVDQISSPVVRSKDGLFDASLGNHFHSLHWKTFGVELRVHDLARTQPAMLYANQEPEEHCQRWPEMSPESQLHVGHAGCKCTAARNQSSQPRRHLLQGVSVEDGRRQDWGYHQR